MSDIKQPPQPAKKPGFWAKVKNGLISIVKGAAEGYLNGKNFGGGR